MEDERQSDLIMASALAKTLSEVVERLEPDLFDSRTVDELRALAERAEAELHQAA
jgi:hypothetical protein